MVKQTITHSLKVTVHGGTTINVTDATAALTALEQFKQGVTVVVPGSEDGCKQYIPYHAIITLEDCATVTSEEVSDNLCEEKTPADTPEP